MRKKPITFSPKEIMSEWGVDYKEATFIHLRLFAYNMQEISEQLSCSLATTYRIASKPRIKQILGILMTTSLNATAQDMDTVMRDAVRLWHSVILDDSLPAPIRLGACSDCAKYYDKIMESNRQATLIDHLLQQNSPQSTNQPTFELIDD